ncbi:MAG: hypothetical protein DI544_05835 [Sphingomonas taxi]|uniref:Uncharacterized protein n=1 Tax=Sphingomonas taxi TaxID=1549858 RepID=A0A2W5P5R2_9SPHN|nr:MAG: hypothetical protein DI544_05835 [Sphingomonas taxi]
MGFVALLLLAGGAFAAMALWLRVDRLLWSTLGAALCIGGIGYAWQGRPLLPAAPARHLTQMASFDADEARLREGLLGKFTADSTYLVAADAMTRTGNDDAAARVVLGGLSRMPRSFILWTWAGTTLAADGGDQVTPPALLAFRQAARLAPEHPAPPYYLGLAYVRAGEFAKARPLWARAVRLSAPGTDYRRELATRLMLLNRLIALAR